MRRAAACGRGDDSDIFANSGFFQTTPDASESNGGETVTKERSMNEGKVHE